MAISSMVVKHYKSGRIVGAMRMSVTLATLLANSAISGIKSGAERGES